MKLSLYQTITNSRAVIQDSLDPYSVLDKWVVSSVRYHLTDKLFYPVKSSAIQPIIKDALVQ